MKPLPILIIIEDGLVQEVVATRPTQYTVLDFDTDGADDEDLVQFQDSMRTGDRRFAKYTAAAYANRRPATVHAARVKLALKIIAHKLTDIVTESGIAEP